MINNPYSAHSQVKDLITALKQDQNPVHLLEGLSGSARSAVIHACLSEVKGPHLILFHDKEEAAYFYTDLVTLEGTPDRTLFFPSSYKRSIQYSQTDEANIITRTQTLRRLSERRVASFIISYAEALIETVITKRDLNNTTLEVKR